MPPSQVCFVELATRLGLEWPWRGPFGLQKYSLKAPFQFRIDARSQRDAGQLFREVPLRPCRSTAVQRTEVYRKHVAYKIHLIEVCKTWF